LFSSSFFLIKVWEHFASLCSMPQDCAADGIFFSGIKTLNCLTPGVLRLSLKGRGL
jgi:hypothetical protein